VDSQTKFLHGKITWNGGSYETPVELRFEKNGKVQLQFPELEYDESFDFICNGFSKSNAFSFSADDRSGTSFYTDKLILTSASTPLRNDKLFARVEGFFSYLFQENYTDAPTNGQQVRYWMKSFESFGPYKKRTALGVVRIRGTSTFENYDRVGGFIELRKTPHNRPLSMAWEYHAIRFLDYLHRMMQFARCSPLPITTSQSFRGSQATSTHFNPRKSQRPFISPIHFLNSNAYFDHCIDAFFKSARLLNSIRFGIEWLNEPQHYNELRLVVRMLSLENFVEGLLTKEEKRRFPKGDFLTFREKLSDTINAAYGNVATKQELVRSLGNLNTRSLREKITLLIEKYRIPSDDISNEMIRDAINARNDIIHRGVYYQENSNNKETLWRHITVINELLVRTVFTLIEYDGGYVSWLGGRAHRHFPTFKKLLE